MIFYTSTTNKPEGKTRFDIYKYSVRCQVVKSFTEIPTQYMKGTYNVATWMDLSL